MASRARLSLPYPDAADPERPPPALPSELLEEIFLRVGSPADLARASTACVAFRDLIADHTFLRRYRSIHPPLLLGFVSTFGFHPAEAPHPSAAVARSVEFSFVDLPRTPKGHQWLPCDVRDGRVLFESRREKDWDLMVCDPLSERGLLLPPIADEELASVDIQKETLFHSGASFFPSGGVEEEDTSFRVINWIQTKSRLGVFIFSSVSWCWFAGTSITWGEIELDEIYVFISELCTTRTDCFFWKLNYSSTMVKFDLNGLQFWTIPLPSEPDHDDHDDRQIVIVESAESGIAMFSMIDEDTSVDYYTLSQNHSEKTCEWHFKSTIPLPADYYTSEAALICGPAEGYIFIECNKRILDEPDTTYSALFSLDIKSFNIEKVGRTSSPASGVYPYFGFPPSMSPRRI